MRRFSRPADGPRPIAGQLVSDDHPRHVLVLFEQLTKELLGCLLVAPALHQDVQHIPILINGTPQVLGLAIDLQKDLIQMPLVAGFGAPALQLIGILLALSR